MDASPKILIVEDEHIIALDYKVRLQLMGYQVVGKAAGGEKSLQLAEQLRPDLVLMDIRLSGDMDGIDAATRIRERLHLPVVFITGMADDVTLARAKFAESFGCLLKPFDDQALKSAIEIALYKHKMEEALRQSELKLKRSQEIAHLGHWSWDTKSNKLTCSDEMYRILGIDKNTYTGDLDEIINTVVHPDDRIKIIKANETALSEKKSQALECRIARADGSSHIWYQSGDMKTDDEGNIVQLSGIVQDITERKLAEQKLQDALTEISTLKERLEAENVYLIKEMRETGEHGDMIGESLAMNAVFSQAKQVASTSSTVLLLGETGTGKELLARAIHNMSPRKNHPLVIVNCAAMPAPLVESELFGREKGAYTGALTRQIGRFEVANGSTIFLDEIGELPLETQAKLLRVLQEGQIDRLGSNATISVDVRVIAATNRNLQEEIKNGNFRLDLFYRLNVFPITLPPLREHREDIPAMVWAFVQEFQKRMGKTIEKIPSKTMTALQNYPWVGNVRELRNAVERAMILSNNSVLLFNEPSNDSAQDDAPHMSLDESQRKYILEILNQTSWRVRGKNGASELLKINPSTLESKMLKLGIRREDSL